MDKSTTMRTARSRFQGAAFAVLLCVVALHPGSIARAQLQNDQSLYRRVGGYDFIAKFVDTAFPRVAMDSQLHRLFQGHSVDSQIRQRQLIVDALCQAMGGPCFYIGRPMKPLHEGLGITESDWTVFMGIISGTLDELKVGQRERADWLKLFREKFKPDVIDNKT